MATFITRIPGSGDDVRLAVKDLIDVAGVPTTAGTRALAAAAVSPERDAPCLAGARAAGARIVGKTNLNELAYGASGVNEHFGTPVNPLDPSRVPGGSSSGSAVAVADGEADVASLRQRVPGRWAIKAAFLRHIICGQQYCRSPAGQRQPSSAPGWYEHMAWQTWSSQAGRRSAGSAS